MSSRRRRPRQAAQEIPAPTGCAAPRRSACCRASPDWRDHPAPGRAAPRAFPRGRTSRPPLPADRKRPCNSSRQSPEQPSRQSTLPAAHRGSSAPPRWSSGPSRCRRRRPPGRSSAGYCPSAWPTFPCLAATRSRYVPTGDRRGRCRPPASTPARRAAPPWASPPRRPFPAGRAQRTAEPSGRCRRVAGCDDKWGSWSLRTPHASTSSAGHPRWRRFDVVRGLCHVSRQPGGWSRR